MQKLHESLFFTKIFFEKYVGHELSWVNTVLLLLSLMQIVKITYNNKNVGFFSIESS